MVRQAARTWRRAIGQSTAGFRHVYSHVHFSGPTENFSRAQLGTEVQSKTNLDDLVVNYQLTDRVSLTGTLPFLYASRRQQSQYATLHTSGLSDVSFGAQTWIRSPKSERAGINNAQIGLSLLIPTGNDHQNNVVATSLRRYSYDAISRLFGPARRRHVGRDSVLADLSEFGEQYYRFLRGKLRDDTGRLTTISGLPTEARRTGRRPPPRA